MDTLKRLNGLDLFSGIGGNTLALREWIKTIAYCDFDRHAQSVLLSRMADGSIEPAPIWDNITTLTKEHFDVPIDIIVGGFPCQDLSTAGKGAGIKVGTRSGLFYEVIRLVKELKPAFVFLENVPAIRTRGLDIVLKEFTEAGYDCRWTMLSASSVGANHQRERWFLLAYPKEITSWGWSFGKTETISINRMQNEHDFGNKQIEIESVFCRENDGVPYRLDRFARLGNSVVPLQAQKAFEILMGII